LIAAEPANLTTQEVPARPKLGWSPDRIAEVLTLMRRISIHVTPTPSVDVLKENPTGNRPPGWPLQNPVSCCFE